MTSNHGKHLRRLFDSGALLFGSGVSVVRRLDVNADDGSEADGAPADEVFAATITTPALDSYDSIVHPDGGDFSRYSDNPVVYLEHGWMRDELPIGKTLSLKTGADQIDAEFVLAQGDEVADRARNLMRQGVLGGTSIGFVPTEMDFAPAPRSMDDDGEERSVLHVYKWQMLEFSVVGIPSNPEALIHRKRRADVSCYPSHAAEARSYVASLREVMARAGVGPVAEAVAKMLPDLYGVTEDDIEEGALCAAALRSAMEYAHAAGDKAAAALLAACIDEAINSPEEQPTR